MAPMPSRYKVFPFFSLFASLHTCSRTVESSNLPSISEELGLFPTNNKRSGLARRGGRTELSSVEDSPGLSIHLEDVKSSEFAPTVIVGGTRNTVTPWSCENSLPSPSRFEQPPCRIRVVLTPSPDSTTPPLNDQWPFPSKLRSTGTTIVGCLVENGKYVVLGADTRATDDRMVADKRCEKIHRLTTNVWCCGAGTSADLEALARYTQYSMALDALQEQSIGNSDTRDTRVRGLVESGGIVLRPLMVSAVCRFLRSSLYEGHGSLGCNLIVGGYDPVEMRGRLVAIHPHGSMDVVPYAALGSGGLAAMAVLEANYHPNLTLEQGIALVKDAVSAGIENDLGSGSQVDLCVLGANGRVDYQRAAVAEEQLDTETNGPNDEYDQGGQENSDDIDEEWGVNGFGNLPYTVQSRRLLATNNADAARRNDWNAFLGFSSTSSKG